jgi:carbamoyl-phosphate synthase large subunit
MALGRTFEEALLKAMRSLELGIPALRPKNADMRTEMEIEHGLTHATDERLFLIFEALYRGMTVDEIQGLTNVDPWFLTSMQGLVRLDKKLRAASPELLTGDASSETMELIALAKRTGFGSRHIAESLGVTEARAMELIKLTFVKPVYKMVDTCAAEFEAATPYFYSCSNDDESETLSAELALKA